MQLTSLDRRIVAQTQAGLAPCPRPYEQLAQQLQVPVEVVMARLQCMHDAGVIRRIAAVPNHYALGYKANAMTVWDIVDERIDRLGPQVGALACVSHCYRRPRRPPLWPYNLFAMVHGHDRHEVDTKVEEIAALVGDAQRAHDLLFSVRILKKTGMRLVEPHKPVTAGHEACSD